MNLTADAGGQDLKRRHLRLDTQTIKDLEIFSSLSEGDSLFDFCNKSRSEGGSRVLKERMQYPWTDPEDILATQVSLSFISAHRSLFNSMPSAYSTGRVEHYIHEVLPIVTHTGRLDFALGAFTLWANHDLHYLSIVRGVQVTAKFIQALRQFAHDSTLDEIPGELGPIIEELRALLETPGLKQVPQEEIGSWVLRILKLDQSFRLHHRETLDRILQLVFEIDALLAMADVVSENSYVMPTIATGELRIIAEDLIHPFVPAPVPNPVELNQDKRLLFLTGPNMAGKTTYLRAFSTALYFAHLGMGVPAKAFTFVPVDSLFSSISLSDDLRGGVSYFRAEALRVKAIAEAIAAGARVAAVMDEPFKGTNVKDAFDASLTIIERFANTSECVFMFSSHLIEVGEQVKAGHIDCRFFDARESEDRLRFDYKLQSGISSQRLGMRVLTEEGIFDLLDQARAPGAPHGS